MLEIVSRQRALNFPPGTRYSYSNTGYNLAAILVSRVSGKPFAEFTRAADLRAARHDAHLVARRLTAASSRIARSRTRDEGDGFRTLMPFENVHGNGGLLTTVGDLLKWNQNFASPTVGDAAFVAEQQQPGKFNDGRVHQYALGLDGRHLQGRARGRAQRIDGRLSRAPDALSRPAGVGRRAVQREQRRADAVRACVADIYLADRAKPEPMPRRSITLTAGEPTPWPDCYRDTVTGEPLTSGPHRRRRAHRARRDAGGAVADAVRDRDWQTWEFDGRARARASPIGTAPSTRSSASRPPQPTAAQLQELAGTYVSDEAETTFTAAVEAARWS